MTSAHAAVFLLALICVPKVLLSVEVTKVQKDEENYLNKTYNDMNKKFKNLVNENLKSVIRFMIEKSQEFNLSSKCRSNSFKLLAGLRNLNLPAVSFFDSIGKPSDGLLAGNFQMLGNYDQCLNSSILKKSGEVDFRGQYCAITIRPILPNAEIIPDVKDRIKIIERLTQNLTDVIHMYVLKSELLNIRPDKFGLCVPSGCGINDVEQLVQYAGKQLQMNFTVDFCDTEDSLAYFNSRRITFICIYAFFILLLLVGSAIDQYSKVKQIKFENTFIKLLLCFSIITNFPKFLNTQVTDKNLSHLNGVRVLSLFYVVLGHHYLVKAESSMMRNAFMSFLIWFKQFFFQIVMNGTFTVDVFFFVGGFLNCYIRAKKNCTEFSVSSTFEALGHRLFRFYPALISSFILIFLLHVRGPLSHLFETKFGEPCLESWWRVFLFINNFQNVVEQCFPQTWYLCCDMQYFLVSLITIPLLFKKPKTGVMVNSAIIFISILITAVYVYVDKLAPSVIFTEEITEKLMTDFFNRYQSPFTHAAPYFGGALLGFFLTRNRNIKLSKITLLIGWIVVSAMFCTMLFVTKKWNSGDSWTRLESALYYSLARLLYSWSVGWLIFVCFTGYGGVINYLLSLKLWIPLNRLCLTMYLISPLLQIFFYYNLRSPMDAQTEIEIWGYFGDLALTFLVSLPFLLLFESPFIALEKILFPMNKPSVLNESKMKENEMKENEISQNEMEL